MELLKIVTLIFVMIILNLSIVQRTFVHYQKTLIDMDAPYQILLKIANGTKSVHSRSVKLKQTKITPKIIQTVLLLIAIKRKT